ncbi:MAG: prepilin-type N-terminal cleavage/methylation domain-containing protein [Deltaproteobacteria bacterium]|nr:prepilin-type N-terminal cleavage/methylation domain-containing protein [Deltaproteobacteria bacterium]
MKREAKKEQATAWRPTGYTLVELMIVVLIIGIMSAIAAPALMESRKRSTLGSVPRQTLSIFETARARSLMRNAAMRIIITRGDTTVPGNIVLHESLNTSCNFFPRSATDIDRGAETRWAIMTMDLNTSRYTNVGIHMSLMGFGTVKYDPSAGRTLTGTLTTPYLDLCLNRRGLLLENTSTFTNPDWLRINSGGLLQDNQVVIGFQRREDGLDVGVERIVLVKQGAVARIMR